MRFGVARGEHGPCVASVEIRTQQHLRVLPFTEYKVALPTDNQEKQIHTLTTPRPFLAYNVIANP